MRLFIMRHGQTQNNIHGRITGRFDEDINETGILQAENSIEYAKSIDFDIIISSPLRRAIHTAEIINYKELCIRIDNRLTERDMGSLTNSELHSNINRMDFWNINPIIDYGNVEPMSNMFARVGDFYEDIKKHYQKEKLIIVTHEGFARVLHSYIHGIPKHGAFVEGHIANCEIREVLNV